LQFTALPLPITAEREFVVDDDWRNVAGTSGLAVWAMLPSPAEHIVNLEPELDAEPFFELSVLEQRCVPLVKELPRSMFRAIEPHVPCAGGTITDPFSIWSCWL